MYESLFDDQSFHGITFFATAEAFFDLVDFFAGIGAFFAGAAFFARAKGLFAATLLFCKSSSARIRSALIIPAALATAIFTSADFKSEGASRSSRIASVRAFSAFAFKLFVFAFLNKEMRPSTTGLTNAPSIPVAMRRLSVSERCCKGILYQRHSHIRTKRCDFTRLVELAILS